MVSYNSKSDVYEIESKVLLSKNSTVTRRSTGKTKSRTKKIPPEKCASPLKGSPLSSTWVGRNKGKFYIICLLSILTFLGYRVMMKKLYATAAMIYNDYGSNIKNLESLEEITESIESLCYVSMNDWKVSDSLLYFMIFTTDSFPLNVAWARKEVSMQKSNGTCR